MITLALDLGTKTGFAVIDSKRLIDSGSIDLSKQVANVDEDGAKWVRFNANLERWKTLYCYDQIAYENVLFTTSSNMSRAWFGALAILSMFSETNGIPLTPYPIQTIKKYATGRGNAIKADMVKAVELNFGKHVDSDDEADAICIGALHNQVKMKYAKKVQVKKIATNLDGIGSYRKLQKAATVRAKVLALRQVLADGQHSSSR